MITKLPFGKTGHDSSRIILGAAAFMSMRQERVDPFLELLQEFGVNHIDVAASYGDAELPEWHNIPAFAKLGLTIEEDSMELDELGEEISLATQVLQ